MDMKILGQHMCIEAIHHQEQENFFCFWSLYIFHTHIFVGMREGFEDIGGKTQMIVGVRKIPAFLTWFVMTLSGSLTRL